MSLNESTEGSLQRLARAAARHVRPHDPHGALQGLGLRLRAYPQPLELPGKRVYGAWDPVLRRIEVFGCDGQRSDEDIVRSLGHELGHALFGSHQWSNAEIEAERFAGLWLSELGPQRVQILSQSLRELAANPHS